MRDDLLPRSSLMASPSTAISDTVSSQKLSLSAAPLRISAQCRHIALLGNFPPRRCGIATYTEDSYLALVDHRSQPQVDLYIMDDGQVANYGDKIAMLIPDQDLNAYQAAADRINASGADIVWIQHEFGIFGGEAGSHLLALVNRVKVPIAITLHTILETPNDGQRAIFNQLLARASTIIVMVEKGREILDRVYGIDHGRVTVIAHGIPDRAFVEPTQARLKLGLAERPTLLTFGLLAPDKGIADVIEALPEVRLHCPAVHYIVLGATHPHLKRHEGERYREALMARVAEIGLQDTVTFVDRFVELDELTNWLAAADVYVTPYRNPAQITSGTLSYAVGMGKAVVSTPYVHASEILADGRGMLVPFSSPTALASALSTLLTDTDLRDEVSRRAYRHGRSMIWPRNADAVIAAMRNGARPAEHDTSLATPTLSIRPIERMTDDVGMLQHSILNVADRRHGYCIDDNARGLLLMSVANDLDEPTRTRLASIYAGFVQHGWNDGIGRFRNFMGYNRTWLEDVGSEDSNGRTLWSLGVAAHSAPTAGLRRWALRWYDTASPRFTDVASPRARAFAMLGACETLAVRPGDDTAMRVIRDGGELLLKLLAAHRRADWVWFETVLSYDNTRMCEAMIEAGTLLGEARFVAAGLETLEWIAGQTRGSDGQFQPVGTTSFGQPFATPSLFDQQPVEAWAMVDACAVAWRTTGDDKWIDFARAAHDWFLGANVLSLPVIDAESGECCDGITPLEINLNNGAESVIAWQAARRAYERLSESAATVRYWAKEPANAA